MKAWEDGDADVYRAACAADVRMEIPAYGLDIRGFDAIWGVRTSMGAGPLDMHTVHSHSMQGAATVQACATVINRVSGQVQQQSTVRFTFDESGRLVHYFQENLPVVAAAPIAEASTSAAADVSSVGVGVDRLALAEKAFVFFDTNGDGAMRGMS